MRNFLLLLILLFGSKLFSQQNTENSVVPYYNFPKIKSSITMPVKIPLSEIGNIINNSVPTLIFEDNSFTDNNNDQFKVKVWKTRPIRLVGGTKQNLLIEVPLKIWAEKGIGTFGLYNYQNTTFETVMYFNMQLTFNNNWKMVTKTSPMGYKWVSKPVLDYGKFKVPITSLVESSLVKQQADFCKTIDDMMLEQLNFQQYAIMAWNQFSEPFQVSEEYNTWLKITPISVNITPLTFYGNRIDANIGIDTYSETFTGRKPASSPVIKTVANFNSVQQLPQNFLLQTTVNIPFSEATAIAEKMFLGKEFDFREGKSKVKINSIKVFGEEDRIMIEAQTEGAIEGTSYISGTPVYDPLKRKIVLSDTKFKLKTKNILYKTVTLLFQGKIVKMIEDEYGIPTAELENSSKKSIEETFNKEYYKGLNMKGKVFKLTPSKIILTPFGITAVIDTQAQLELFVKGM
ncbi:MULTISPECIES: DUF4403 family protein [unclassified Kaistella]|uniref:DUF4403 family protein n=1 Tax=unclassified Kaistella TaxID=2762626 RepID=UPI0027372D0D|nr:MULTISPECIES: DUF4403 family protein [unclassified Kaistella]MDP2452566.1 DUF4403 family protein [Kaistella sp. SH11-4b]MDP2455474.1 DUF4403 family protein [Kaistella sp. SH40-3]MDP2458378.1 DUF4403 family protein [Kaistella sp. SH19-2b]